jgi:septal ring-binding cell division protein DamX
VPGTAKIRFSSTFYANVNRWYRPTTPDGYSYKPIGLTTEGTSIDCDETSYSTCISACNLSTTTTSTTSTSTSTTSTSTSTTSTSTSTTTAAPILISVQLDEYDGGNPPYLDMDMVVAGSTYYYDGGSYTQYVPANISSNITLKTKDGVASHLWGSFTTASATLKVFEDGILIVNQTNFYKKNEGAIDFTSGVTFTSGKSYIVSGSNWTFVGTQPATTTTTSTTSTSTSTTTTTTTAAPTTTSTTTVVGTTTSTTTTCGPLPPYSYTMYYDYDDGLPIVVGFTDPNDACTATNSFTVYSYDSPLIAGSELYFDTGCGPDLISGQSYYGTQNHYRIGNDVIRLNDTGFAAYVIYDFVQTCGTTTTTTSTSSTTTTTAGPSYNYYTVDRYSCFPCSLDSSTLIARSTNLLTTNYFYNIGDTYVYEITNTASGTYYDVDLDGSTSASTCLAACSI